MADCGIVHFGGNRIRCSRTFLPLLDFGQGFGIVKNVAGGRAMGGRGGVGGANKSSNAVKGIALLQGAVSKARTDMLISAYSYLDKKTDE